MALRLCHHLRLGGAGGYGVRFTLPCGKASCRKAMGMPAKRASLGSILRMPIVLIGIAMFFCTPGWKYARAWVYTLFTQGRGITEEAAGLWVSIYWGSFTIGRIFFGAIITRVNSLTLLRGCMLGVVFGALLVWWNPVAWIGFAELAGGFAQGAAVPVMVSNTPRRVSAANAANAIGFQVRARVLASPSSRRWRAFWRTTSAWRSSRRSSSSPPSL
ncbi:MAG: hypothetical protein U0521_27455 [Anaerolineae bacterium]